ncbi:pyridoxal phosphate-dependent transferase [Pseudomassariella vexata]|uniref:Pyridoxal phosphate-dependent transferase n=1 Tax=Pseudomassariella vexata TaxID=1141098 RepID=A0A1Y2DSK9_9PEZI|nr:pyridoxal phosphate-dependent transferase [Pseudomassariella vexata]ORY62247.1 pyridoxal phosphate-dependent transferase [Pseudomassariella vexata]
MEQVNGTNGTSVSGAKPNNWLGHKGAAAFDLRSDTQTTPTPEMLAAIQATTLDDDVFDEDKTTHDLQSHVASLTGKDAALIVLSGTMGNQLALRSLLTQPPHSVLCDHRSHIIQYEAGGVASLCGAMITAVVPKNGIHLTLEDVKKHACLDDNIHHCPTRVISLENTLSGLIMPLEETRRISSFAREHGIKMHCDGARLWEAVSSGAGSIKDFAECFDTLSLCFSKGLGAPIGSILVGTKEIIKHARWMRKAIGGGIRQSGVVAAAARVALTTFGEGPNGVGGRLKDTHAMAKRVGKLWRDLGGELLLPVQTNMVWLDLESMGTSDGRFDEIGAQYGLKLMGHRLITHYQIGEEAISKLTDVFKKLAEEKSAAAGSHVDGTAKSSGPYSTTR